MKITFLALLVGNFPTYRFCLPSQVSLNVLRHSSLLLCVDRMVCPENEHVWLNLTGLNTIVKINDILITFYTTDIQCKLSSLYPLL